jgi:hypothetical protein
LLHWGSIPEHSDFHDPIEFMQDASAFLAQELTSDKISKSI